MSQPTHPENNHVVKLMTAVRPIIKALDVQEGELGADIRQGRICPPDMAIRSLPPTESSPPVAAGADVPPMLRGWPQALEESLNRFLTRCSLTVDDTVVPLRYGRIELAIHHSEIRDVLVLFRLRPALSEDQKDLKTN